VVQLLDSDELRKVLTPQPSYSAAERDWFYDVLVFLAELLANNGVNVIIAATAAQRAYRDRARERLSRFAEVYVDAPAEVCAQRDPKGLWQKVESGAISDLPGADLPYEPPLQPEAHVNTAGISAEEGAREVLRQLLELGIVTRSVAEGVEKGST
jgi:adenylylsulfate kinase